MNPVIPAILSVALYLVGAVVQSLSDGTRKSLVVLLGFAAIALHGVTVFLVLHTDAGFNLGLYPMLSLSMLAVSAIVLASSLRRPVENLFIVIFPIAALTLLLEISLKGSYIPREAISGGIAAHIILSLFAWGLLTVAALQAAFLSLGDYELKHSRLGFIKRLPPLETMDALLFEMLGVGLVLLSLSIFSGFIFLENIRHPGLIHHTVITFAAWVVFTILIWGRLKLGWRGVVASRWALSGFGLLVLGYFGSKLVLEVILKNATS